MKTAQITPVGFKPVAVQQSRGDQTGLLQRTGDNERKPLSSSSSRKIEGGKKVLTSSLGDDRRFRLNSRYIKKLPDWRGADMFSPKAELGTDMQLHLLRGLKVSGQFRSRMADEGTGDSRIFHAGDVWGHTADPFGSSNTERDRNSVDMDKQFIALEASGQLGDLGYGAKFLSWGSGYESLDKKPKGIKEDEAGRESWVSWKQGGLELKTVYSEYWDNVGNDPEKSRSTDRLVSISPSYTLHDWPYVGISVAYGQGTRQSSMEPSGKQPYSGPLNMISTSFDVSMDKVSLYLGAALEKSSNDVGTSESSKITSYFIGGSYYPFDSIYISPDFGIDQEEYLDGVREYQSTGTYSSLSLGYKSPVHPYRLNLYAGHDSYKGGDGYSDTDNISASLSLDWDLRNKNDVKSTLSFEISRDSYIDHINSGSSSGDMAIGVIWRRVGF